MKILTNVNLVEVLRSQSPTAVCHLLAIRWNCIIFLRALKQLQKVGKPCVVISY